LAVGNNGVIVLACAFAPVANIQKRIKGVMDKTVVADSAIITEYNEAFAGNKTITSFNLQENEINKFSWILKNIFTLRIKMVQRTQWLSPMMHVIVSIGIAGAIAYGSHLIMTGAITAGNFVSFITALILLYTSVKSIGNNLNSVQFSFFAIEQVFEKLDGQPAIRDKENAIPINREHSTIKFENVNFEYVKDVPVLKNINLEQQAFALFNNKFESINDGNMTIGDYIKPKRGKNLLSKDAIYGDVPVVAGGLSPATYHNVILLLLL
jgi:subfamily B ATP-binding cassette protein MsbA